MKTKFNYWKTHNEDEVFNVNEYLNIDETMTDVLDDIATRYSIPKQSLDITNNLAIAQRYEDMWYIGLRRFTWIDNPGVEPYHQELGALNHGYIIRKKPETK